MHTTIDHCKEGLDLSDYRNVKTAAQKATLAATYKIGPDTDRSTRVTEVLLGGRSYAIELDNTYDRKSYKVTVNGTVEFVSCPTLTNAKFCAMRTIFQNFANGLSPASVPNEPMPEPRPAPVPEPVPTETLRQKTLAEQIEELLSGNNSEKLAELERKVNTLQLAVDSNVQVQQVIVQAEPGEPATATVINERTHEMLPVILYWISVGKHVLTVGPSGSGKTTLARQVARALNRPFFSTGAILQKYELLGYTTPVGEYVSTVFYEAWTRGGLFLWDEIDASNPNALVAFHAMLDNGHGSFPGHPDEVEKHPDFICMAGANTYGKGADFIYQGREALDGATIERFKIVTMDYDESLEMDLALAVWSDAGVWVKQVQRYRAAAAKLNIRHIISPRASIDGAQGFKDIAEGKAPAMLTKDMVEFNVLWKGLDKSQIDKIKEVA